MEIKVNFIHIIQARGRTHCFIYILSLDNGGHLKYQGWRRYTF